MGDKKTVVLSALFVALVAVFAFGIGLITASSFNITGKASAADIQPIPQTKVDYANPFVQVVKNARKGVVSIKGERTDYINVWSPWDDLFNDPFFRKFFGGPPSQPRKRPLKRSWLGSGFIVNIDGENYVLTNNHVVEGAQKLTITLDNGETIADRYVELVGRDPTTDVAVLKIKKKEDFPALPVGNSDNLQVGEWVIAIGSPFGLRGTVTAGVVSAKGRSDIPLREGLIVEDFIQTDAAINPGNSGGPLLNIKGEVVGINTAIVSNTNIGIGFAIPINLAMDVAKSLIETGTVARGYLGIIPQELTDDVKEALRMKKNQSGVVVAYVEKDSPAEKGGLKPGDVIVKFNGKDVTNVTQFRITVATTPPGKKVKVVVIRDGKRKTLEVKLGERPELAKMKKTEKEKVVEGEEEWLGMKVESITPSVLESLGIKEKEEGVIVSEVEEDSPAYEKGIEPGDIIKKVENIEIHDITDFRKAKKKYEHSRKPVIFQVKKPNGVWKLVAIKGG